jgi:hypothetical protein
VGAVVYTESGATPSSFTAFPPTVFTFVEPNAALVCGP